MAGASPQLDAVTSAALEKLADIVVPPPVPWIPQTWGWAALAVVVLALGVWALVRWRRHREANRYRNEALAELARLEARLNDPAARSEALAAMPPLLKRVALVVWPRPKVASLTEQQWVGFLRANGGGDEFPDAAARILDDVEYRSPQTLAAVSADDAQAFARAARNWIERHRVSA